jgi:hypothetical protein
MVNEYDTQTYAMIPVLPYKNTKNKFRSKTLKESTLASSKIKWKYIQRGRHLRSTLQA